jgi:MFS family permease
MAFGTLIFILPLYAQEFGVTYSDLGKIGATGKIMYTFSTIISGVLLDIINKKRYLVFSNFLGAISIIIFIYASSIQDLMLMRGLFGTISAAFWVSISTILTWSSPKESLTKTIGYYNLSWIIAFIISPLFGGIITTISSYETLFIIITSICLLSSIFSALTIKIRETKSPDKKLSNSSIKDSLSKNIYNFASIIPYSIVLGVYMAIIPGILKNAGFTNFHIGILLTITNASRGLMFLNAPKLAKFNIKTLLKITSIFLSLSFILMIITQKTPLIAIPLSLFGITGGVITPMIQNLIAQKTPNHNMGISMGIHEAVYGLGLFVGPLIGGPIADIFGPLTLFIVLAITALSIIPISIKMEHT